MTRGNAPQTKVIYKGKQDSFVVFVESVEMFKEWKKDRSTPLAQVMAGFKIMHTHGYVAINNNLLFVQPQSFKGCLDCERERVCV